MASKAPNNQSVVVESTQSSVGGVSMRIIAELEDNNFSQEDIFAVHLALEEAFLNAMKHGNKMDPKKEIKVDYAVNTDRVEISMMDQGEGFEPMDIPDPRRGENLYKTEGRGLLLMRSYMDVIEYNESGNCVRMVRYKEKPQLMETQA